MSGKFFKFFLKSDKDDQNLNVLKKALNSGKTLKFTFKKHYKCWEKLIMPENTEKIEIIGKSLEKN